MLDQRDARHSPRTYLLLALLIAVLLAALPASADFAAAAERIRDSVVTVTLDKRSGTGFIVNPEGDILTNSHVLGQGSAATVKLANGDELTATVTKTDPQRDLLLLKVERKSLPAVVFASSAKLKQGSEVAALGAPLGLSDTLTKGIVSSLGREIKGRKYLQIDAALNKGNSGGPIINDQGQVVGVATLDVLNAEKVGFAIPSDDAMAFLNEANITFSTLDATPAAGEKAGPTPAPAPSPGSAAPAAPATPAVPAAPPVAPPPSVHPVMWLAGAALIAFAVALVTSLLVARSVARASAPVPTAPFAAPAAPGWGAAPPAPAAPSVAPAAPVPQAPPTPRPAEDLSDIDIELR